MWLQCDLLDASPLNWWRCRSFQLSQTVSRNIRSVTKEIQICLVQFVFSLLASFGYFLNVSIKLQVTKIQKFLVMPNLTTKTITSKLSTTPIFQTVLFFYEMLTFLYFLAHLSQFTIIIKFIFKCTSFLIRILIRHISAINNLVEIVLFDVVKRVLGGCLTAGGRLASGDDARPLVERLAESGPRQLGPLVQSETALNGLHDLQLFGQAPRWSVCETAAARRHDRVRRSTYRRVVTHHGRPTCNRVLH